MARWGKRSINFNGVKSQRKRATASALADAILGLGFSEKQLAEIRQEIERKQKQEKQEKQKQG